MKASLIVKIQTPYGEIEGKLNKNRVVEELSNSTYLSVLYWNMEKIQKYAEKKGWKISLHTKQEPE